LANNSDRAKKKFILDLILDLIPPTVSDRSGTVSNGESMVYVASDCGGSHEMGVQAVYVESCSMFVRGGVYRAVREALGGTAAKFSVSALMFDYVLTGPLFQRPVWRPFQSVRSACL
jgi:hypothetical protein